jgi:hypothetical protein
VPRAPRYNAWPRSWLTPRADNSDFARKPGDRAFGDQLGIVCLGPGGNQDHIGAWIVSGQQPGQGEAALVPEPDVGEDDVWP